MVKSKLLENTQKFRETPKAVLKTGVSQGNLSEHMNGKRNHVEGFTFKFEAEVIGKIYENEELLK